MTDRTSWRWAGRLWVVGLATVVIAAAVRWAAAEAPTLRAGDAAVKVTPPLGASLDGYFMKLGPVTGVHDDLFARALVLDDGRQRIAILICDMTVIPGKFFDRAKRIVEERTGIPRNRVLMACTHTHSAPRVGLGGGEIDRQFFDGLVAGLAEAVSRAVENLAPAKVAWGSGSKPEYTYNRRWHMKPGTVPVNPFGRKDETVQFNPPPGSPNLLRPAGPVDPEVSVLSVQHADGRPLAVLANYSIHYVGGFKSGEISADYFGVFSKRIAELLKAESQDPPFVGMMSNGSSGNIGAGTDFRTASPRFAPYQRMHEVGCALADEVRRVLGEMEYRDDVTLAMAEAEIELGVRKPDAERMAWARKVLAGPKKKQVHGWTVYYAREAEHLAQWSDRVSMKLQAVRIGDCVIGAIPCEVFAETGLAIKEASPKDCTFVIELANQYCGYLPTPEQHALGAYETWPARSSCLEVEAATKIRAAVSGLMEEVCRAAD